MRNGADLRFVATLLRKVGGKQHFAANTLAVIKRHDAYAGQHCPGICFCDAWCDSVHIRPARQKLNELEKESDQLKRHACRDEVRKSEIISIDAQINGAV